LVEALPLEVQIGIESNFVERLGEYVAENPKLINDKNFYKSESNRDI